MHAAHMFLENFLGAAALAVGDGAKESFMLEGDFLRSRRAALTTIALRPRQLIPRHAESAEFTCDSRIAFGRAFGFSLDCARDRP